MPVAPFPFQLKDDQVAGDQFNSKARQSRPIKALTLPLSFCSMECGPMQGQGILSFYIVSTDMSAFIYLICDPCDVISNFLFANSTHCTNVISQCKVV